MCAEYLDHSSNLDSKNNINGRFEVEMKRTGETGVLKLVVNQCSTQRVYMAEKSLGRIPCRLFEDMVPRSGRQVVQEYGEGE